MRELRASIGLNAAGVSKGVSETKSQLAFLVRAFQATGKSLAEMLNGPATRGAQIPALKTAAQEVRALENAVKELRQRMHGPMFPGGPLASPSKAQTKDLADLEKALEKARTGYGKLSDALARYRNAGRSIVRAARVQTLNEKADERSGDAASRVLNSKLQRAIREDFDQKNAEAAEHRKAILLALRQQRQANEKLAQADKVAASHAATQARREVLESQKTHWRSNPPPVIQSGLAGLLQKLQAEGSGSGRLIGMIGMMMGGGRGAQLGGGIGELLGSMGGKVGTMLGAAAGPIGMVIGMIASTAIAGFKKIFDFIKEGLKEVFDYARSLQNQKLQTGIGYKSGSILTRMAEMGGVDTQAVSMWISRFQANLSLVEKTAPKVANALFMLGLPLTELRKMKPEEALDAILDRLEKIPNWADQSGNSIALFNRQGAAMQRLLFHRRIAREQLGETPSLLNATAWTNARGEAVKFGDVFAYIGNSIGAVATKLRGFFVGMGTVLAKPLSQIADIFNKMDFARLGKLAGEVLRPIVEWFAEWFRMAGNVLKAVNVITPALQKLQAFTNNLGIGGLLKIWSLPLRAINEIATLIRFIWSKFEKSDTLNWLKEVWKTIKADIESVGEVFKRIFSGLKEILKSMIPPELRWIISMIKEYREFRRKEREPDAPVAPEKENQGGLGPLSSFWAPFGKGPGDQWSKVGAFSAPFMNKGFATGIKGWQDKVTDLLKQIAINTRGWGGKSWHEKNTRNTPQEVLRAQDNLPPAFRAALSSGSLANQTAVAGVPAGSLPKDMVRQLSRPDLSKLNILPDANATNWLNKIYTELKGGLNTNVNVNAGSSGPIQYAY